MSSELGSAQGGGWPKSEKVGPTRVAVGPGVSVLSFVFLGFLCLVRDVGKGGGISEYGLLIN